MHRDYLRPVWGVEDLVSSLKKSNPELDAAQAEADAATQKLEALQAEAAKPTPPPDPRQEAEVGETEIGGSQEGDETGAALPDAAPLPPDEKIASIDRFWFMDNFGMSGREMSDLLIKTRNNKALDARHPLLNM